MAPSNSEWFADWFNEDYLTLYTHRDEREAAGQVAEALAWMELPGDAAVLDLGCGTGRHARELARQGLEVTGIDLSETLLDIAREQGGAHFVHGDMRDLGDIGPFDAVLSFFTSFGYFAPQEDAQVLCEVARVLKRGGLFYLDYLHPDTVTEGEETISEAHIIRRIEGDLVIKTIAFPDRSYEERVRLYTPDKLRALLSVHFSIERERIDARQTFLCRKLS